MSTVPSSPSVRRKKGFLILASVLALSAFGMGGYYALYAAHFVSTDNAYAAVEMAQITPFVAGTVAEVRVKETQMVKKGDILVVLDSTDAQLALAQAEARLAQAVRKVKGWVAQDGSLGAQVAARAAEEQRTAAQLRAAQADVEKAKLDLSRREALSGSGAVSGEELSQARTVFQTAQAQLEAARSAVTQARAHRYAALSSQKVNAVLIDGVTEQSNPEVALERAKRDQAAIDLERTVIRAPISGIVAKRGVQLGQRVQAGTPLLSLVPVEQMHIDANFKEVQLREVQIGQTVEAHADIYGKSIVYHGVVEGFSGGSGAAFSAIPAQNATGNWIKVVQRLPVRIRLNPEELKKHPLKVGLSMDVSIDLRSGASGKSTP